jgi:hypothetical protein
MTAFHFFRVSWNCFVLYSHVFSHVRRCASRCTAAVPLPAVGPLAELLSVTRQVCSDINSAAVNGSLTAACVSTLVNDRCVKLLGKLVCWLQQQPQEQLLLNSEQQESLWQLLLVTLANMLRVVQKDAAVAAAFNEQLQASGGLSVAVDFNTCSP